MKDFYAAPVDKELTAEGREASGGPGADTLGAALQDLDRASEEHRRNRGSNPPSQEFIDSILAMRSSGLKRADLGMRTAAAQAARERIEVQRRLDDSENFKLMARILVQMDQDRVDNLESGRKQRLFNTLMAVVGALLALGGVVVPFIIETLKGWK